MRLFIALELPEEAHRWLAGRQEEMKRCFSQADLRWTPSDQWHVTLRFLGETPEHQIPAILTAMKRAAEDMEPFQIAFGKPGTFSGPRMGVLWIGVESGLEPLKKLAARLNESLEAAGFPAEKRPFRAHITLARSTRTGCSPQFGGSRSKISSAALRNIPLSSSCPQALITTFHLYQSTPGSSGSLYTRLHTVASHRTHPEAQD